MSFDRYLKIRIGLVFILAISTGIVCPVAHAEWVWNPKAGTFLRGDAEIKDTDKQQVEYILELLEAQELDSAQAATKYLVKFFPGSRRIPEALFHTAKALEEAEEYNKAFKMYQEIIEEHPNNNYTNQILLHQFEIGVKFLEGARLRVLGVKTIPMLTKAEKIFATIKKYSPYHEYGEKAQYYLGMTYEKMKEHEKALDAYETLLDEYPNTRYASDASFRIGEIMYKMAQESYETEYTAREAHQKFDEFIGKYPNSLTSIEQAREYKQKLLEKEAAQIYKTARYYEKLHRLESAQIYYREVVRKGAGTKWARKAERRLNIFANPEAALAEGEQQLRDELARVEDDLVALEGKEDSVSEEEFEREQRHIIEKKKELRKELKNYDKKKSQELELRWEVLERKEKELKARRKNIERKRALLKEKPSGDLEQAIARWESSVEQERFALQNEREELERLSERMGYRYGLTIPFLVSTIDSVDIDKLKTYKAEQRAELRERVEENRATIAELFAHARELQTELAKKADAIEEEETRRDRALQQKEEAARQQRADDPLWKRAATVPVDIITYPTDLALSMVRRDDFDKKQKLESELDTVMYELERVEREIRDARRLVKQEQKNQRNKETLMIEDKKPAEMSDRELRRMIKRLEKEINEQYRVISDAEDRVFALSQELLTYVEHREKTRGGVVERTGRALVAPGVAVGRGVKMFLFGVDTTENEAEERATRVLEKEEGAHAERIQGIRNSIALEKQKAAAARIRAQEMFEQVEQLREYDRGGFFSSLLISPIAFFADAGDSAKDLTFLEDLIAEQTEKRKDLVAQQESLQGELAAVEARINGDVAPAEVETTTPNDAGEETKTVVIEPHMSKRQIKREKKLFSNKVDLFDDVLEEIEELIDEQHALLDDAESLVRKQLDRVNDVVEKYEGSTAQKYADVVALRKERYAVLDYIASLRQELAVHSDDITKLKQAVA